MAEKNWKYGHDCIKDEIHEETTAQALGSNNKIVYCIKCGEYLYTKK